MGRCCGAARRPGSPASSGKLRASKTLLCLSKNVGGPIFALHGSKAEGHSSICRVILVWLAAGSTLAWVVCTSPRLSDQTDSALATTIENMVEALSSETPDLLGERCERPSVALLQRQSNAHRCDAVCLAAICCHALEAGLGAQRHVRV